MYQGVIERLLVFLYNDTVSASLIDTAPGTSQNEFILNGDATGYSWPPWPWPPWGDDDDDEAGKPEPIDFAALAASVVAFEKKIANASLDLDKLYQDPLGTYNPAPITNLTTALPQIAFGEYFATMTPRAFPERVIITYPAYAGALSEILAETNSSIVEAYLVAQAALQLSPSLGYGTEPWKITRELTEELQVCTPLQI